MLSYNQRPIPQREPLVRIIRNCRIECSNEKPGLGKPGLKVGEIAPETTGHGLPLRKCEAYNRVYDQPYESR